MLQLFPADSVEVSSVDIALHQPILIVQCNPSDWSKWEARLLAILPPTHLLSMLERVSGNLLATCPLGNASHWLATRVEGESFDCYIPAPSSTVLDRLQELVDIVERLRSPDGCPWDRAQTPQSLTPYILEEAYETVAAIRSNRRLDIVEELGDLLLQVVLQAQIYSETDSFTLADVAEAISTKLVRRHPHVFGPEPDGKIAVDTVHQRWEAIKAAEKATETTSDKLHSYANTFPPLLAAAKIVRRAKRDGVTLPILTSSLSRDEHFLQQLQVLAETSPESAQRQLGSLLLAIAKASVECQLDPVSALESAIHAALEPGGHPQTLEGKS